MTKHEKMIKQQRLYYEALIAAYDASSQAKDVIMGITVRMDVGGDEDGISERMDVIKRHIDTLNNLIYVWDGFERISLEG